MRKWICIQLDKTRQRRHGAQDKASKVNAGRRTNLPVTTSTAEKLTKKLQPNYSLQVV